MASGLMPKRPIEELQAGDAFRQGMLARADSVRDGAPSWHGWVIMDAFLAGIDWERAAAAEPNDDRRREIRTLARLAWNNWPDTEEARKRLAEHEARDPISAAAWDRVISAVAGVRSAG